MSGGIQSRLGYSVSATRLDVNDGVHGSEVYRNTQVIFGFKGYTRADLGASYTRNIGDGRQVTFYAKVENLFDRKIFEEGFRAPGATALSGFKLRF